MAPGTRLIGGTDKVRMVFQTLSRAMAENIAHALNLGADELVRDAKILVPIDEGDLKQTIDRSEIQFSAAHRSGSRNFSDSAKVFVFAGDTKETAQAAYRSEHGRKKGGAPPNQGHPGHRKQEFMNIAFFKTKKRAKGRINRAIQAAVREAANRGR